jgi:hypothetical protein
MNEPGIKSNRRAWGHYVVLADEPNHKVKRIVVDSGQRLSLQRQQRRREQWCAVSGPAMVTREFEEILFASGGSLGNLTPADACQGQDREVLKAWPDSRTRRNDSWRRCCVTIPPKMGLKSFSAQKSGGTTGMRWISL